MLHWGLGLVAVLIPVQLFFGHLTGLYVHQHQPAKFAAIEARWQTQQPATEVLIAWPDEASERNLFRDRSAEARQLHRLGQLGLARDRAGSFPAEDRPPVLIPFFGFRIMVGMGLIMLGVSWLGNFLRWRGRLETTRWFLWAAFLSFPTGFIAVLCGWYTAEVGRQPWVVYGLLRTRDAVTPSLTTGDVLFSLPGYVLVYAVICALRHPLHLQAAARGAGRSGGGGRCHAARRPLAVPTAPPAPGRPTNEPRMEPRAPRAVLGRGHRSRDPGLRDPGRLRHRRRHPVRHHPRRGHARADDGQHRALLGRQRDLAGGDRRKPVRGLPGGLCGVPRRLLPAGPADAGRADLPRHRVRVPLSQQRMRRFWDCGFFLGSMVVAFVQGAAVGAMMRGIPVENMQYAGGAFNWLHPFPVLTGVGLVLGYALLGACWIVLKTEGALRDWAYARIPWLVARRAAVLALAFVALTLDFGALAHEQSAAAQLGAGLADVRPGRASGRAAGRAAHGTMRCPFAHGGAVLPHGLPDARA